MKKQSLFTLALASVLALSMSACGKPVANAVESSGTSTASNTLADSVNNALDAVGQLLSGDVTGEVGKNYSTQWFTFNVKSIETVAEYAGYTPAEGNKLIDVVVTEKNIFGEEIPMGTIDFYLDEDSFEEYVFPIAPLDDTMMPEEFGLAANETVEYHLIYEVPEDISAMNFMFTEFDESETVGATFTIPFTV